MSFDARVYVDESYSVKDNIFYLSALIVPQSVAVELDQAWQQLRQQIKKELVAQNYFGVSSAQANSDWLPEIHAVALYQSEDEFEKYDKRSKVGVPNTDKDYWYQHVDWLEQALVLQSKFDLPLLVVQSPVRVEPMQRSTGKEFISEALPRYWNSELAKPPELEGMFQRMRELESRAFTWAFPELLLLVEHELQIRQWQAEIICDDEPDNRGFRLSTLLSEFYQSKAMVRVNKVLFEDSKQFTGLQIVDVHSYLLHRSMALQNSVIKKPKPTDDRLIVWVKNFTAKQMSLVKKENYGQIEYHYSKILFFVTEYLIMNAGGPQDLRQQLWESLKAHINEATERTKTVQAAQHVAVPPD